MDLGGFKHLKNTLVSINPFGLFDPVFILAMFIIHLFAALDINTTIQPESTKF